MSTFLGGEKLNIVDESTELFLNNCGSFDIGGFDADSGCTGRKIVVDAYGPRVPVGGGAFSGKDPSKVDRSAAYAARHVAKNIVAAGLAERCELQLSYAIGYPEPVSILVDTQGTATLPEAEIMTIIREIWDLSPAGIIKNLDLTRPIYRKTAAYGHFGRMEPEFTWEQLDQVERITNMLAGMKVVHGNSIP